MKFDKERARDGAVNALYCGVVLAMIVAPLVAGCSREPSVNSEPVVKTKLLAHDADYSWKVVEFNGHQYVVYGHTVYAGRSVTMVHDPDCPCYERASREKRGF